MAAIEQQAFLISLLVFFLIECRLYGALETRTSDNLKGHHILIGWLNLLVFHNALNIFPAIFSLKIDKKKILSLANAQYDLHKILEKTVIQKSRLPKRPKIKNF
ncbi:hypothetical protein ACJX0J_029206 [Zea mays]